MAPLRQVFPRTFFSIFPYHKPQTHMPFLFVYGTLKRSQDRGTPHPLLRTARYLGPAATCRGWTLYRHDSAHFPVALPNPGTGVIHGELYEVVPDTLCATDRYEGKMFVREEVQLKPPYGDLEVWMYVWQQPDASRVMDPIPGGEW